MFLLRKCYLLDFEVWALHMSHTMYLPTLTSTTGNMASIKFINNSEFTHDFSWVVVNKGLVFRVMTPLYFPLWKISVRICGHLKKIYTCCNAHRRKYGGFHGSFVHWQCFSKCNSESVVLKNVIFYTTCWINWESVITVKLIFRCRDNLNPRMNDISH